MENHKLSLETFFFFLFYSSARIFRLVSMSGWEKEKDKIRSERKRIIINKPIMAWSLLLVDIKFRRMKNNFSNFLLLLPLLMPKEETFSQREKKIYFLNSSNFQFYLFFTPSNSLHVQCIVIVSSFDPSKFFFFFWLPFFPFGYVMLPLKA